MVAIRVDIRTILTQKHRLIAKAIIGTGTETATLTVTIIITKTTTRTTLREATRRLAGAISTAYRTVSRTWPRGDSRGVEEVAADAAPGLEELSETATLQAPATMAVLKGRRAFPEAHPRVARAGAAITPAVSRRAAVSIVAEEGLAPPEDSVVEQG